MKSKLFVPVIAMMVTLSIGSLTAQSDGAAAKGSPAKPASPTKEEVEAREAKANAADVKAVLADIKRFDPSKVSDNYSRLIESSESLAATFYQEAQKDDPNISELKLALHEADKAFAAIEELNADSEYWNNWRSAITKIRFVSFNAFAICIVLAFLKEGATPNIQRGFVLFAIGSGATLVTSLILDLVYFQGKQDEFENKLEREMGAARVLIRNVCSIHQWAESLNKPKMKPEVSAELKREFPSLESICSDQSLSNLAKMQIGRY